MTNNVGINNTSSLQKIVALFNDFQVRNLMLNGFGFGTQDELNAANNLLFPLMWVNYKGSQYTDDAQTENYNFEIFFVDKISSGENNYLQALSDQHYIVNQFVGELKQHPFWDAMNLSIVKNQITLNAGYLIEDFNAQGVKLDMWIKQPMFISYCNSPVEPIVNYTTVFDTCNDNTYRIIGNQGPQGLQGPGGTGGGGGSSFTGSVIQRISGSFSGLSMSGTPTLYYNINFGTASFVNNYCVAVESDTPRNWTIQQKTNNGFVIESNSGLVITDTIYWEADELVTGLFGLVGGSGGSGTQGPQGPQGVAVSSNYFRIDGGTAGTMFAPTVFTIDFGASA